MAKRSASSDFNIQNIVASANLELELDLYTIANKVKGVEYEPEQFPGAILKLKDPKASLLLFKNGKIICTGSKSEAEVRYAIERALKLLTPYAKGKRRTSAPSFNIENIVASAALGVELDLYTIANKVSNVEYEPEQFPGAILKLKDPKASLLLFKNGKIICAGSKSKAEVGRAIEQATKMLAAYSSKPKK
jgi:transcription initiation factor TFIID TATA-box-binding protein